mmetsp:Transcript_8643/g.24920  ORF Transcript_8643/g.24920 Transcript_8643/m.24920 type:complete len:220 (-) Transcript_8643:1546-2205(-)
MKERTTDQPMLSTKATHVNQMWAPWMISMPLGKSLRRMNIILLKSVCASNHRAANVVTIPSGRTGAKKRTKAKLRFTSRSSSSGSKRLRCACASASCTEASSSSLQSPRPSHEALGKLCRNKGAPNGCPRNMYGRMPTVSSSNAKMRVSSRAMTSPHLSQHLGRQAQLRANQPRTIATTGTITFMRIAMKGATIKGPFIIFMKWYRRCWSDNALPTHNK